MNEITTIEVLHLLGYRCEIWPCGEFSGVQMNALEVTDLRTAATVYVLEPSTLERCIEMITVKNKSFEMADKLKML